MKDKRKIEMFEKDREKLYEKQQGMTDEHDLYHRAYFGSPTVVGIIIIVIILVVVILGNLK